MREPVPDYEQFARIAEAMIGTHTSKFDDDAAQIAAFIRGREINDPEKAADTARRFRYPGQLEQIDTMTDAILERVSDA